MQTIVLCVVTLLCIIHTIFSLYLARACTSTTCSRSNSRRYVSTSNSDRTVGRYVCRTIVIKDIPSIASLLHYGFDTYNASSTTLAAVTPPFKYFETIIKSIKDNLSLLNLRQQVEYRYDTKINTDNITPTNANANANANVHRMIVSVDPTDGKIVGYIEVGALAGDVKNKISISVRNDLSMDASRSVLVGNLVVDKAYRRQGIASSLMFYLLQSVGSSSSSSSCIDTVYLIVEKNNTNAYSLYRNRFNFTEIDYNYDEENALLHLKL